MGALVQLKVNGEVVTLPIKVVPLMKSTLLMVPSGSEAVAESVMEVPEQKEALLVGAVRDTVGAWLLPPPVVA